MALDTTRTFEITRDELVTDSLSDILGFGTTVTGAQRTHANRALNSLVKSLDAEGAFLWRINRTSQTITASTASYTLTTGVVGIDEPPNFLKTGGTTRTTLSPMSRDAYMAIPDRTVTGNPSQYYVERLLATTIIYLYPVPDTAGTLEYPGVYRGLDMNSGSVTPDFPSSWTLALRYGLDAVLCSSYGQIEKMGAFLAQHNTQKKQLLADDNEHGDIQFVPFGDMGFGGF